MRTRYGHGTKADTSRVSASAGLQHARLGRPGMTPNTYVCAISTITIYGTYGRYITAPTPQKEEQGESRHSIIIT